MATKTPTIEVYADNGGKFRFRIVAKNGETVASSEAYASKASCMGTVRRLGDIVKAAMIVDTTKAPAKK